MNNDQIRTPSVSIPLDMEEGVRPSAPKISKVTWNPADSEARSVEKIKAREEAIAEFHQQAKQKDPDYLELQHLRSVVEGQQQQIQMLMKLVKPNA